jgi:hypothetical protein
METGQYQILKLLQRKRPPTAAALLSPGSVNGSGRSHPAKTPPYTKEIARRGIWVEPQLLAEIEYRRKSSEGKVRHPRERKFDLA